MSSGSSPPVILGSALAIFTTIVGAVALVRSAPVSVRQSVSFLAAPPALLSRGVEVVIEDGQRTIRRTLPAMAFHLDPDESLDRRVPAGPLNASFTVTFDPGRVRFAKIGAELRGGSVIVRHNGRELASDATSPAEPVRVVLSREPVALGRGLQQVQFEFTSGGGQPASLRGLWRPEGSSVDQPLPSVGSPLLGDEVVQGQVLVQQFNCVVCHQSSNPALQRMLAVSPAPWLGAVGARARPEWMLRWLADPQSVIPGTAMPRLLHQRPDAAEVIDDLTSFLVSLGGPLEAEPTDLDEGQVANGRILYHDVGCVACHGPLEPQSFASGGAETPPPLRQYTPLGTVGGKTTVSQLAAFLVDPLASRPSGRMPSMLLNDDEAAAIAAYCFQKVPDDQPAQRQFDPVDLADPQRVARGRKWFAALGCANCHGLGPDVAPVLPTLQAPPLESLAGGGLSGGCLAPSRSPGVPDFSLTTRQRNALTSFLEDLPGAATTEVPHDQVATTITRLQCTACHTYLRQPPPEPAVTAFFRTIGEADLGDEGRLPPDLSGVGARLNPGWLGQVLDEQARIRPYLAVRMPHYGADNVGDLPGGLCAVAGVEARPDHGPDFSAEAAEHGRALVGASAMNCIQCHDIAERPSTGTPGPDLARMVERLRYENFFRWVHDPGQVRRGTRMPSFFVGGRSGFVDHYDGSAQEQIRAIWSYLSQGDLLPLPEGLIEPAGLELEVVDRPLVFRTFMETAGVRAIACGFPEQVHCAFDAERGQLMAVWSGRFLSASGAWAARGGSETNPEELDWTAGPEPLFALQDDAPLSSRFMGYRLDEQGGPIFLYRLVGAELTIEVAEQPIPVVLDRAPSMQRRFEVTGPPGRALVIRHGQQRWLLGPDGAGTIEPGTTEITLDSTGRASFALEVTW